MFDFHNHFTDKNAFKYTATLLPNNIIDDFCFDDVKFSEIGLDRRFENVCSFEKQTNNLKKLLEYAKSKNIGVSLHCVGRTGAMIDILKSVRLAKFKAVWHGFCGSAETAKILYDLGVIISFRPDFHRNIGLICEKNPLFVLETDYDGNDENEYYDILQKHYRKCAKNLNIDLEELEKHCYGLAEAFKN